jgi:hypothetical protein
MRGGLSRRIKRSARATVRQIRASRVVKESVARKIKRLKVTAAPDLTPLTVAAANARLVLDALREVGAYPFWIPDTGRQIRFGVTVPEATALLAYFSSTLKGAAVYIDLGHKMIAADHVTKLPTGGIFSVFRLMKIPHQTEVIGSSESCIVEVWHPDGEGLHVGPAPNPYSQCLDISPELQVSLDHALLGSIQTLPVFTTPIPSDRSFPVDVVFTWVNDADADWRSRRDRALEQWRPTHAQSGNDSDALIDHHFRQHDELRYALRSFEYFAPWVNRFFLVTDRQRPDWIDDTKITIVDHRELLREGEADAVGLYNSHAISAVLHRIPGLAENYLVANDDVFLGRPATKADFFEGNGNPYFFNTRTTMPELREGELDTLPHVAARRRTMHMVRDRFGVEPRQLFMHAPYPQSRSLHQELEKEYPDVLAATLAHPFRSVDDHEPIWLHNYMGYEMRRTTPGPRKTYTYVALGADDAVAKLRDLALRRKALFFCINDTDGTAFSPSKRADLLTRFLKEYFPVPSRFER